MFQLLRQSRQMLADLHARNGSFDRRKLTTNLRRSIRFWIEHIQLARSAAQMHDQNRLGSASRRRCGRRRVREQWQRRTHDTRRADSQPISTTHLFNRKNHSSSPRITFRPNCIRPQLFLQKYRSVAIRIYDQTSNRLPACQIFGEFDRLEPDLAKQNQSPRPIVTPESHGRLALMNIGFKRLLYLICGLTARPAARTNVARWPLAFMKRRSQSEWRLAPSWGAFLVRWRMVHPLLARGGSLAGDDRHAVHRLVALDSVSQTECVSDGRRFQHSGAEGLNLTRSAERRGRIASQI